VRLRGEIFCKGGRERADGAAGGLGRGAIAGAFEAGGSVNRSRLTGTDRPDMAEVTLTKFDPRSKMVCPFPLKAESGSRTRTMIEKIRRVRSFGSYVDFDWPTALCQFKRFNVFYGWNYSGKTMLSRILRCFESKTMHPDFPMAQAQIDCAGGASYQLVALDAPLEIRVFNSDFVRDNLKFETGSAAPVLILGALDIAKQEELDAKKKDREQMSKSKGDAKKELDQIEASSEKALTAKARDAIKIPLSVPGYDRTSFLPRVLECMIAPEKHLLDDEAVSKLTAQYVSKEKKDTLATIIPALTPLDLLRKKAADALAKSVTGRRIARLEHSPAAERWVDTGRPLHEKGEICLFCGQPLPPNLMDSLKEHFSSEYDLLMNELADLSKAIEAAGREQLNLPHATELYPEQVTGYTSEKECVERLANERRLSLEKLSEAAEAKRSKAFAPLECPQVEDTDASIAEHIANINELIEIHNKRTSEFEQTRRAAFLKLEMHAAASFVIEQDYATQALVDEKLRSQIEEANKKSNELDGEILSLELETSEAARGAERINDLLKAYFGKEEIRIVVSEAKQFQILRDGRIAKNLSEGEKTAIAFAYFVTRIQDGRKSLPETIVVIDDPVSSLDANHLFHTYALIKNEVGCCGQLLLLTHNFEFFNLIKEWAHDEEGGKIAEYEKWRDWSAFHVARADSGASRIEKIPPELMRFKSEYHYLFGELYRFSSDPTGAFDRLFSLPNVVRRFMEAFGGIMIPKSQGLNKKMSQLFNDPVERECVWKFINQYSHQTTVTRSLTIPDAGECGAVVNACLNAVRTWDADYYRDLESEVQ
jgi:wobble nucleotide-excising tRNase